MKKIIYSIIAVIIATIIVLPLWYNLSLRPVSNNTEGKKVNIEMGTSNNGIAKVLKKNNIIRSKTAFKIYIKLHKTSNFQAGTYLLKESMTIEEITKILQKGIVYDQNQITITYLEGKPFTWLAKKIASVTNNKEEDVYNLVKDEKYLNKLIKKYWFITEDIKKEDIYYALEGYLFPDTYLLKDKDVTVEEIFEKFLNQMERVLEEYRTKIEESKYSVHEILTIASIIEGESIKTEDRKDVASVINNRLNSGRSIGSDVTTYYAIQVDMGERNLKISEINSPNPYNTRGPNMNGKLPVGPISSVSKSSINATINPSDTDYMFFVADKTGKLYFTRTNAEHEQKIRELRKAGNWYEYKK